MMLLTSVGINAELWAGHKSYRYKDAQKCTTSLICSALTHDSV